MGYEVCPPTAGGRGIEDRGHRRLGRRRLGVLRSDEVPTIGSSKPPRGVVIGVLWHAVTLNVVAAGTLGLLTGSLSRNARVGLGVAVGWLLVVTVPIALLVRRRRPPRGARKSLFVPPRRLAGVGIRWRAKVVHIQRRQAILGAVGHLNVSHYEIEFVPRRGQSGPFMPVYSWKASLDQVRSIDVTTPSPVITAPTPHVRITTADGRRNCSGSNSAARQPQPKALVPCSAPTLRLRGRIRDSDDSVLW